MLNLRFTSYWPLIEVVHGSMQYRWQEQLPVATKLHRHIHNCCCRSHHQWCNLRRHDSDSKLVKTNFNFDLGYASNIPNLYKKLEMTLMGVHRDNSLFVRRKLICIF